MLTFPAFDPVAIHLGPLAVRWYGLAYVAGMLGGLWLSKRLAERCPARGITATTIDDLFTWVIVGVIAGGRLGHIVFYALPDYGLSWLLADPLVIFRVWEGGMSFHGGVVGVVLAMLLFARTRGINPVDVADRVVPVLPLGLGLGRIANFINGELWGKPTDSTLPWSMVFPHVDALPRHPSQLYEVGLEGLVLGFILWLTVRRGITHSLPSGVFLLGYGLARIVAETFREPDGLYTLAGLTLSSGQLYSLPMVIIGLGMMGWATHARR